MQDPKILTLITCGICFIISYTKYRSIICPAVTITLSWLLVVSAYEYLPHGLYVLSINTYYSITIWVIGFTFGCFLFNKIRINKQSTIHQIFNTGLINRLFRILIIINCLGCIAYWKLGNGGIAYNALAEIAWGNVELPLHIQILQYFRAFAVLSFTITTLYREKIGITLKLYIYFTISLCVWILIAADKTGIMQISIIVFCNLYIKRSKFLKYTSIGILGIIGLLLVIQNARAYSSQKEETLEDIVAGYVLSTLPAYDAVITGEKQFAPGKTTRFIKQVLSKAKLISPPTPDKETRWIKVPVMTNAYTVMQPAYVDFGLKGVFIMAFIQGIFWILVYNEMKAGSYIWTIMFVNFYYTLPFQFFDDYLSDYTSVFVQAFLITIILTSRKLNKYKLCSMY